MARKRKKNSESSTDNNSSDRKKKNKDVSDPNGTVGVSRGQTPAQLKKLRETLQGVRLPENNNDRLKVLRKDDATPNLSQLSTRQQHALKHRNSQRTKLDRHETNRLQAAVSMAQATDILQTDQPGLLETEHEMERTAALTQQALGRELGDRRNIYDLQLPGSSYGLNYDRSGRYALLYGHVNGHTAVMDCHDQSLVTEFSLPQERIRDACFLHNFSLYALAQSQHAYIYDHTGAEIHRLEKHIDPAALEFLPYHWLLASIGRAGYLYYQDVSTGEVVSSHRTKLGSCRVLRQNPSNAVLHAGHHNGTVTLWSPASSKYLAKMLCHKGMAVTSLAVDGSGRTMVTGGADGQVKVWDLRMYKSRHTYYTLGGAAPISLDISQRNLLGVAHGKHVTVWKAESLRQKEKEPYMRHLSRCGRISTLRFRPFEDVCGIGHETGMSSLVIPGSGEPTLDTTEVNPMEDAVQRRETEVRALLDKLQPEMIALDASQVGGIEASDPHLRLERIQDQAAAANPGKTKKQRKKKRGRSKIQTQLRRKQRNVVDQNILRLREAREAEKKAVRNEDAPGDDAHELPDALKRFS